jgi:hypothetical protein
MLEEEYLEAVHKTTETTIATGRRTKRHAMVYQIQNTKY